MSRSGGLAAGGSRDVDHSKRDAVAAKRRCGPFPLFTEDNHGNAFLDRG